jgi:hypothetical protein
MMAGIVVFPAFAGIGIAAVFYHEPSFAQRLR